jgi:ribosomal protein L18E
MKIVLAKDEKGRPVHPALYGLYHQADTSDHEIQIELSTQRATMCAVDLCKIERYAGRVQKDVVLIRLNLGMIDRALASELSRRADGLIPFAGLKKKERYAEVLGHELAHVVRLLTNTDYRGLYLERQALADTGSRDIQSIKRLTSVIEEPAEAAEAEIWRELAAGLRPKI